MKKYIVKYYPFIDGKEKEYMTTVLAKDKVSAEAIIRKAYIEQLKRTQQMLKEFNMVVIGGDASGILKNIEYAKKDMRIEII